MPKKNKRPKTPKVSMKQSVKQHVSIHLGKRRNTGLEKVAQHPRHPQPSLNFVSNYSAPKNDTSLLYRELFETKAKLHEYLSPFQKAVASQAVDKDRLLETEQLKKAESNPIRRTALAPVSSAERFGLDVGTVPQPIGEKIKIQQQGPLGFTEERRLTEEEYLAERKPPHKISQDYIREQRLFHLKKPHNTIENLLEIAEHDGHTFADSHPVPNTIEQAIQSRGYGASAQEKLQFFEDEVDNGVQEDESPDRKRDGERIIGEPVPPVRLHHYLREHGTAGDIERYARQDYGPSLHAEGKDLAFDEEVEAEKKPKQKSITQFFSPLLDRAELGQGEGILNEEAYADKHGTGVLETREEKERRRGAPKKYRPENIEPTTGKGRKISKHTVEAEKVREATRAHRARAKELAITTRGY